MVGPMTSYPVSAGSALSGVGIPVSQRPETEPPRLIHSRFADLENTVQRLDSRITTLRERLTPAMGPAIPSPVKNQGPAGDQSCSTFTAALGGYIAMIDAFNERLDDMIQRVEL